MSIDPHSHTLQTQHHAPGDPRRYNRAPPPHDAHYGALREMLALVLTNQL
ncbi:hypothetical protein JB92DRAFT_3121604 [Gautieria morchelliformis]|nr:hypothetical protein JB92DRAFT_3121604 [Gautieria morchelliformis]